MSNVYGERQTAAYYVYSMRTLRACVRACMYVCVCMWVRVRVYKLQASEA